MLVYDSLPEGIPIEMTELMQIDIKSWAWTLMTLIEMTNPR